MPRYDYQCRDCGSPFEVRMSMSEYSSEARPPCTRCGSFHVERTFGSVSVLTGSGGNGYSSTSGSSCGAGGFT